MRLPLVSIISTTCILLSASPARAQELPGLYLSSFSPTMSTGDSAIGISAGIGIYSGYNADYRDEVPWGVGLPLGVDCWYRRPLGPGQVALTISDFNQLTAGYRLDAELFPGTSSIGVEAAIGVGMVYSDQQLSSPFEVTLVPSLTSFIAIDYFYLALRFGMFNLFRLPRADVVDPSISRQKSDVSFFFPAVDLGVRIPLGRFLLGVGVTAQQDGFEQGHAFLIVPTINLQAVDGGDQ